MEGCTAAPENRPPKSPSKHKAAKTAVLTLGQQARKEQEAGLESFEAFLAKGEPTAAEAAKAVKFLTSLEQQKFHFGIRGDLVQGGLFALAYMSAKFPDEHKSEEVDQLVNQLAERPGHSRSSAAGAP